MSKPVFYWTKDGAGWVCALGDVTMYASPERTRGVLGDKAARGTKWRAGVSVWDDATKTISRYGRDCYHTLCATADEAKCLAETVFSEQEARADCASLTPRCSSLGLYGH